MIVVVVAFVWCVCLGVRPRLEMKAGEEVESEEFEEFDSDEEAACGGGTTRAI